MVDVKFFAKCTTCKKTRELTGTQVDEARVAGVAFSDCCNAVATIERVEVRNGKAVVIATPENPDL